MFDILFTLLIWSKLCYNKLSEKKISSEIINIYCIIRERINYFLEQ